MKFYLSFFTLLFCSISAVTAQELMCRVNVDASEMQNVDQEIVRNMESSIQEFVNSRIWTNNVFEEHEKIEMALSFKITGVAGDNYQGTLLVQSKRPVYNSSYSSLMFNYLDKKVSFEYTDGMTLEYEDNTFSSNLTSVVAFYCYMVIGMDYCSFSLNGGKEYFEKAEALVNAAQSSSYEGWRSSEKKRKNRYWMVENLLNTSYSDLIKAVYTYHRLGLDGMSNKPEEGRKKITEAILLLEKQERAKPSSFIMTVLFYAKSKEIVNIFSEAPKNEISRVVPILKKIDSSNMDDYNELLN